VIVLHRGRLLAHGPVARLTAETQAPDIRSAFTTLVRQLPADDASEAA
jgi:hypothetical protein